MISTEAWQIYNDFSKLDGINTNCKLNVKLELATDMKQYANCVMSCYQTDDEMYKKFGFKDLCVVYYYVKTGEKSEE